MAENGERFSDRHARVMEAQAESSGNRDGGPNDQFSNQAEKYTADFDSYHNEIPSDSKGSPNYSGDQYAGTYDKTHPKNG